MVNLRCFTVCILAGVLLSFFAHRPMSRKEWLMFHCMLLITTLASELMPTLPLSFTWEEVWCSVSIHGDTGNVLVETKVE